MKCSPQTHTLNACLQLDDTILGGCRNFRKWGLPNGNRSLGHYIEGYASLGPGLTLLPCLLRCEEPHAHTPIATNPTMPSLPRWTQTIQATTKCSNLSNAKVTKMGFQCKVRTGPCWYFSHEKAVRVLAVSTTAKCSPARTICLPLL